MSKIHIIGAGLSGLAAGVKLAKSGRQVVVYEAAPQAGGRCRSYHDTELGRIIDNGNHLILGANRHALAYIDAINSRESFITRAAYYPFTDAGTGQTWNAKPFWALSALACLAFARRHQTVSGCMGTTGDLYRRFVEPFCLSALNTEPERASAALLRRTLWEIVKNGQEGIRYYLPRHSLSSSLIDPALHVIEAHGGHLHYNHAVKTLESIATAGDTVILATGAHMATKLLPGLKIPAEYNAIVNGHFLCPELAWPAGIDFLGVTGATVQWIFYRNGILSTTTSAANTVAAMDNATIARLLWQDIGKALRFAAPLPAYRIICEKRATYAATPASQLSIPAHYGSILLAGDYTDTSLPATIDSAVKSGFAAADNALGKT